MDDSNPATATFDPFAGPAILATFPTTEPQREIWTACQLGDDASLAYNESITVRLVGHLAEDAFEQALSDLVERHEALRSGTSPNGLSAFVIAPSTPELTRHDLSSQSEEERESQLRALAAEEVSRVFRLDEAPLFRAHLVRLADQEHALVFTAHHIVCDGWSTAVLLMDWAKLYNARRLGFGADLAPASSLEDYVRWTVERDPAEVEADETYWLRQFSGDLPTLDLPSDRPRPPRKTFAAAREDDSLGSDLVQALRKAGQRSRASLFATLFSAFSALLERLSGQTDLVVGVPVAGQAASGDHAELVGHCVNMLPIRVSVDPSERFDAVLGRARTALLDAQEHQSLTFGALLAKLPIPRDPSRLPLVSVIFNLDRGMTSDSIGFQDLEARLTTNPRAYENFDIFLNAVELEGRIDLECQYNTDLFDRETIQRFLRAFRRLAELVAENPELEIRALDLLGDADRRCIAEWNATERSYDPVVVDRLVDRRVSEDPSRIAITFEGPGVSYGELSARADELAQRLLAAGVQRGQLVGLCLPRVPDLVAGALAIWRVGAAYVPLDPDYPLERLAFMVEDSCMHAVVTDTRLRDELPLRAPAVVCVDDGAPPPVAAPLPAERSSEDVAYVIYTSGSTGKPKGVLVPHRSVTNLLGSVAETPGMTSDDVVLAITTLSFDIAVSEIWLPLSVGARIVLASREIASDGSLLRSTIETEGVTFIDATPASYRLLLGAGWAPNSTQTLICTGEAMPLDLARQLAPHAGALWNGYGPTETTVWSTFWQVPGAPTSILIGRPVANTQIYVLDEGGRPVLPGAAGELYISGAGVTHGYLNRPELTNERFLPDPFQPGQTMYRTGDLGRYKNDGDLECLGRTDHQVKLRGFRIELGEIEDALSKHAAVTQAVVALREDRPGDARLVGYIISAAPPAPSELRELLKETLPDYMIPAIYVTLESLPLTPSGKVDRKRLPAPQVEDTTSQTAFEPPSTETEKVLAELWAKLLGLGRVSVSDDFFALGGHSLLASQILGRLRRDHGIELSFRQFFQTPTIRGLAKVVDGGRTQAPAEPAVRSLDVRPAGERVPLSISQERIYRLEEMHPAQRLVHNLPAAWELRGPIDRERLQSSLDRVAERHETLRTTFLSDKQGLSQRVQTNVSLPIEAIDLREHPPEERRGAMFELIEKRSSEPFDLQNGPLFRSTLFQLDDEHFVYFSVRHNLIWDGWSFDIFLTDLCAFYAGLSKGEEPKVEPLANSFGDYVLWHRKRLASEEMQKQVAWWKEHLAGAPGDLPLSRDFERPAATDYAGGNVALKLPKSLAASLTKVAHQEQTTLFMVIFSAYVALLNRYSGADDVLVGVPVRGRVLPEVESLVGPFINTVVLRAAVQGSSSFVEHLRAVRDRALDAFSHEEMPLEMLGEEPPVVRALFSYQDARNRPPRLGDAVVSQIDVEPPAAANDLMVWIMEREDHLVAVANYSSEIFRKETVEEMLSSLNAMLHGIAEDPNQRLSALPLAQPQASEALPPESVGGRTPAHATDFFHTRCQATPEAVAVTRGDTSVTFRELDELAGRVTSALVKAGAGSSARVGVCLDDSVKAFASLLGAWRAGAAVVALPGSDPTAVREQALEAARCRYLLDPAEVESPNIQAVRVEWGQEGADPAPEVNRPRSGDSEAIVLPIWGPAGAVSFSVLSHRELCVAASALAKRIEVGPGATMAGRFGPCWAPLAVLVGASAGARLALDPKSSGSPAALWCPVGSGVSVGEAPLVMLLGSANGAVLEHAHRPGTRLLHLDWPTTGLSGPHVDEHQPHQPQRLGRPLHEARSLVVRDTTGAPVPPGVLGELWLERPHGQRAPTGLVARLSRDGAISISETAGRPAYAVAGQLVHPDAAAHHLEAHPAVAEAYARFEGSEDEPFRVVAYFGGHPDGMFTETELRKHLRERIPGVLVPSVFVELEKLPRLENGLVDESQLPSPYAAGGRAYVAPRTPSEQLLAECFTEVLRVSRVSVNDNFFDLGGHSLLCLRVVDLLSTRHGLALSPRALLLNTLEQAAAELDRENPERGDAPAASAVRPTASVAAPMEEPGRARRVLKGLRGLLRRS